MIERKKMVGNLLIGISNGVDHFFDQRILFDVEVETRDDIARIIASAAHPCERVPVMEEKRR